MFSSLFRRWFGNVVFKELPAVPYDCESPDHDSPSLLFGVLKPVVGVCKNKIGSSASRPLQF